MGPLKIGRIELKPASEGTFITLRKLATMFEKYADARGMPKSEDEDSPGERELIELGLASLVFSDSRRVFRELNIGNLPSLMNEALDLIFELPLETQLNLKHHIEKQMREINRLTGGADVVTPGKQEEAELGC